MSHTPELLCNICSYLDTKDLIAVSNASRFSRTAIHTERALEQKLFLRAKAVQKVANCVSTGRFADYYLTNDDKYLDPIWQPPAPTPMKNSPWLKVYAIPIAKLNPLLSDTRTGRSSTTCSLRNTKHILRGDWDAGIFGQTFLTQPPCTRLALNITLSISRSRHYSPSKIHIHVSDPDGIRFGRLISEIKSGALQSDVGLFDQTAKRWKVVREGKHCSLTQPEINAEVELARLASEHSPLVAKMKWANDCSDELEGLI